MVCACAKASPTALAKSLLSPEAVDSMPSWTMWPTAHPEAQAHDATTEKAAAERMVAKQAPTSRLRARPAVALLPAAARERCEGGRGGVAEVVVAVAAIDVAAVVAAADAFQPSFADLACARARAAATKAASVSTTEKAMAIWELGGLM